MKMKSAFVLMSLLMVSFSTLAHEGHDHDAPKSLRALKGGQIKALEESRVEVVSKGNSLKIYIYDSEMKPHPLAGYKMTAKTQKPREKTEALLTLTAMEGGYEATFDAKGAHRYTLILDVEDSKADHKDSLKFTIEPRK